VKRTEVNMTDCVPELDSHPPSKTIATVAERAVELLLADGNDL